MDARIANIIKLVDEFKAVIQEENAKLGDMMITKHRYDVVEPMVKNSRLYQALGGIKNALWFSSVHPVTDFIPILDELRESHEEDILNTLSYSPVLNSTSAIKNLEKIWQFETIQYVRGIYDYFEMVYNENIQTLEKSQIYPLYYH